MASLANGLQDKRKTIVNDEMNLYTVLGPSSKIEYDDNDNDNDSCNTTIKVAKKISKYEDQEIEIARMLGIKTQIVPGVIEGLGVIKKGIDKQISKISRNINVTELQKIALLGSALIL